MDCKDLMVGDWVYIHEPECKGHRIDAIDELDGQVGADGEVYDECDIRPIHLTKDILVKNGFCENIHYYPYPTYEYSDDENFVVRIAFPQDCDKTEYNKTFCEIDAKWCDIIHIDCEYVHTLQHLLRLCGIKKELTI